MKDIHTYRYIMDPSTILGHMMMNGIFYPIYSRMNPIYTLLEKTNHSESMMTRRNPKEAINSIPATMMGIPWCLI